MEIIELPNGTDFYALSLSPDSRTLAMWSPKHVARIGLDGGGYRDLYIPAGNRSSTQVGTGNVAWTRDSGTTFFPRAATMIPGKSRGSPRRAANPNSPDWKWTVSSSVAESTLVQTAGISPIALQNRLTNFGPSTSLHFAGNETLRGFRVHRQCEGFGSPAPLGLDVFLPVPDRIA